VLGAEIHVSQLATWQGIELTTYCIAQGHLEDHALLCTTMLVSSSFNGSSMAAILFLIPQWFVLQYLLMNLRLRSSDSYMSFSTSNLCRIVSRTDYTTCDRKLHSELLFPDMETAACFIPLKPILFPACFLSTLEEVAIDIFSRSLGFESLIPFALPGHPSPYDPNPHFVVHNLKGLDACKHQVLRGLLSRDSLVFFGPRFARL
jgi:hypothetical protein